MCTRISLLVILLLSSSSLLAQDTKLFQSDDLLELTMVCDIAELQADRGMEPEYHDAKLSGKDANGTPYEMKVQVKARGNFRKSDLTCQFPPLRVRFSKADTLGPFDPKRKLKLVTHCDNDKYILREYMVYKTYNIISEWSLRVRLCKITYVDKYQTVEPETHYAFFIEDLDSFSKRFQGREIDTTRIDPNIVDQEHLARVHVFQYMIGNPDHSVERFKNTKVVGSFADGKMPIPIPYDFDWSEVVDASYTKLAGETRKNTLFSKRKYKPLCRTEAEMKATFSVFMEKREQIFALYKDSPYLNTEDKKYCLKYIKDFFKTIKNEGKARKVFISNCDQD